MSGGAAFRDVTIRTKIEFAGAPPDVKQQSAGVLEYYQNVLKQAAEAVKANNEVAASFQRITAELQAGNQAAIAYNGTMGGIAQYFTNVTQQSASAAESVRLLTSQYAALSQQASQMTLPSFPQTERSEVNVDAPKIGLTPAIQPDAFQPVIDGAGQAADAINGIGGSFNNLNNQVAESIQQIGQLVTSGKSFADIEPQIRRLGESLMNATNVAPVDRSTGVEAIVADAKRQMELLESLSAKAINPDLFKPVVDGANQAAGAIGGVGGSFTGMNSMVQDAVRDFELLINRSASFADIEPRIRRMGEALMTASNVAPGDRSAGLEAIVADAKRQFDLLESMSNRTVNADPFKPVVDGARQAADAIGGVGGSLNDMNSQATGAIDNVGGSLNGMSSRVSDAVRQMELLISSGRSFAEIEPQIRGIGEAILSLSNVAPKDRDAGLEAIVADAKRQFELLESVSNKSSTADPFQPVVNGANQAADAIGGVGGSFTGMNSQVEDSVRQLELLINSAKSFADIEPQVRRMGEALMDASNVAPNDRSAGIEAIVADAKRQFELLESVSNRSTTADPLQPVINNAKQAVDAFGGVGGAVTDMNSQVEDAIRQLDLLINSSKSFAEIEPSVRKLGATIMDAFDVSPGDRSSAIEALVEKARAGFEKVEAVSNRTTQAMSRNWAAASQSMSTALMSAGRLVTALGFLTGQSDDVEKLARQFASVQVAMQAMSASSSMFNSMSEGLQRLQTASTAAQTSLTIMGASASFSTRMLAGIGPMAISAQAALGPISLVMSAISVAVVAAQIAMSAFGDESEDSAKRAEKAMQDYEKALRSVSQEMAAQTASIDMQTDATMKLYAAQKFARGGAFTADEAIATGKQMTADNEASAKARMEKAVADAKAAMPEATLKERAELEARVKRDTEAIAERERVLRQTSQQTYGGKVSPEELKRRDMELVKSGVLTAGQERAVDPWSELERSKDALKQFDKQKGFSTLEDAIKNPNDLQAITEGIKQFGDTLPGVTNILKNAASDIQEGREKSIRFVAGELQQLLKEEERKLRSEKGEYQLDPNGKPIVSFQDEIDKERKKFESERMVAQDLIGDPQKMRKLQQELMMAPTPLAGLSAISGVIPDAEEQALRGNKNLTKNDLTAALKDAAEFETEQNALSEFIAAQQQKSDKFSESIGKIIEFIGATQDDMAAQAKKIELMQRQLRQ